MRTRIALEQKEQKVEAEQANLGQHPRDVVEQALSSEVGLTKQQMAARAAKAARSEGCRCQAHRHKALRASRSPQ